MHEIDEFYFDLQSTLSYTVEKPKIEYGYYIPQVTYGYLYTVNSNGVNVEKLPFKDNGPIKNIMLNVYEFSINGWEIINFDKDSITMKRNITA